MYILILFAYLAQSSKLRIAPALHCTRPVRLLIVCKWNPFFLSPRAFNGTPCLRRLPLTLPRFVLSTIASHFFRFQPPLLLINSSYLVLNLNLFISPNCLIAGSDGPFRVPRFGS